MKAITSFFGKYLTASVVIAVLLVVAALAGFSTPNDDGTRTFDGNAPTYSDAQEAAYCEARSSNDQAIAGLAGIDVPQDAGSGCQPTDLEQMGSVPYYKVQMSTPKEFYESVLGKGFNEGYGLQCVAGFKEFMFSLSGKVVATSTGGASGYASQQRQIEPLGFTWHGGASGLRDGDWGIFGSGKYGHVAMYYQGKWLGQNQGAADANAGNAFNLMSISTSSLIGYYRPSIYEQVPATSAPATSTQSSSASANTDAYTVRRGDTLGQILVNQGWTSGNGLWGVNGDANRSAASNGIANPNFILPGQLIRP